MQRIVNGISYTILVLAAIMIVLVVFMLYWPVDVGTVSKPLPVIGKDFSAGGKIPVVWAYNKKVNIPATVSKSFVNDIVYTIPSYTSNMPPGKQSVVILNDIPQGLPDGEYKIRYSITYRLNLLREETIIAETVPFTIVK
jgi:hypothetical protein